MGNPVSEGHGIKVQDLRRRLRVQPVRKTILFLIDASESMLVNEQMKLAKGAVLGLLTRAYQERHRVGVIVFRDYRADVVLPPTSSITLARNALQALAAGGGTPFAGGLQAVLRVVRSERIRHPNDIQQMILVTDGRPSITMQPGADMRQEVLHIARQFPARNIPSIVLVTEDTCDLIREVAGELKAPLRKISEVVLQMH
ncbi:MAG: VWA domain-containing protein [Spirochaetales bacterium]|nr:VWA domain-containing protein [Spirochaetales bacterium]